MAGVLTFAQFIGGADNVTLKAGFPSDAKKLNINFGQSVAGWSFEADYQTIVIDEMSYNRNTGDPSFTDSTVIGTFAKAEIDGANAPVVTNETNGDVTYILPANMYSGPVLPNARTHVPIVVCGLSWTDDDGNYSTVRWAIIQAWEPDVVAGDPTGDVGYTAIGA
jgi:hypothetical protein